MELPLFPLPKVVLFPRTIIPLHIFEIRYQEMIKDLMQKPEVERLFIIATVDNTNGKNEFGHLNIHNYATIAKIIQCDMLEDGRSNIIILGVLSGQVTEIPFENLNTKYRQAKIIVGDENWDGVDMHEYQTKFDNVLKLYKKRLPLDIDHLIGMHLKDIIPLLCYSLPMKISKKIELLSITNMKDRLMIILDILKMKPNYRDFGVKQFDFSNHN
jgi:Lon protease-like protein